MGVASAVRGSVANRNRTSPKPLLEFADLPWLATAVIVAVALRVLWVAYVNVDPTDGRFDDSVFYYRVGNALAEIFRYDDPYGRGATAQWPPGYPAVLALFFKPFGMHLWLAKGLNIAFASITVVITYLLARQIFDRRVAYVAAVLLAFFPGQVFFSTLVYAETMFAALFMVVLFLVFLWTVRQPRARWWQVLIIGALIGAAALVRAEGVFLLAVAFGVWVFTVRPWRAIAGYTALAALGLAAMLAPWTVRNAQVFGEFIPLRTNLANALARSADPDVTSVYIEEKGRESDFVEGLGEQLAHPWIIPGIIARKLGDLYKNDSDGIRLIKKGPAFGANGEFEYSLSEEQAGFWRGLADRYYFGVGAAALVAAAMAVWRRNRASLVLLMAVLGWTALFAFFNAVTRYHFPLGPIIAIFAGGFLILVWDSLYALSRHLVIRGAGTPEATEPTDRSVVERAS